MYRGSRPGRTTGCTPGTATSEGRRCKQAPRSSRSRLSASPCRRSRPSSSAEQHPTTLGIPEVQATRELGDGSSGGGSVLLATKHMAVESKPPGRGREGLASLFPYPKSVSETAELSWC